MWALDLLMKVPGWIFRSRLFWFIIGANILSLHNISSLYNVYVKECNEKILMSDHDYEVIALSHAYQNYKNYYREKPDVIVNLANNDGKIFDDVKVVLTMINPERDPEKNNVVIYRTSTLYLLINKCGLVLKTEFDEGN